MTALFCLGNATSVLSFALDTNKNKENVLLWYTSQEMQTFKYAFIRDVQRYEQQQQQQQRRTYYYDCNTNAATGTEEDDLDLERYTTYNRVRRRQKRKGMIQICQAVQAFDHQAATRLRTTTTKVVPPPLTELLGQLLQRYHHHHAQQNQS